MYKAVMSGLREMLILAVAACLAAVLYEYGSELLRKAQPHNAAALPEQPPNDLSFSADMPLVIDGADIRSHSLTLLLVTSPTCGYCQASKPFHAAILKASAQHATPFYVAVPELKAAGTYLESSGLNRAVVKEWKQIRAHVNGTPTIIAADSAGVIRRVWLGQLSKAREDEVFAVIADPERLSQIRPAHLDTGESNITTAELQRMRVQDKASVVDVRPRALFEMGHVPGAVNIPMEELVVRAPWELDRGRVQVVDCSYFTKGRCDLAVNRLVDAGYRVAALNAGAVIR